MSDYQGNIIIKNPTAPTGPAATGRAPGMWKLSEVAYWIKQGVWPNANILPDQYFPYVSLLLSSTSLGNANNNLFVDSSGAFNPISRFGNTTQGSFTPYATNWSNYFDGSGDYIQTPSNAAFALPGDFTIEMWIYFTGNPYGAGPSREYFYSTTNNGGIAFLITGTQLRVSQTGVGDDLTVSYTTSANQWYHFAITRSSGTMAIFVNGTRVGSGSVATSYPTSALLTAANNNGYLSNWRIVKGTAVYNPASTTITVPTSPLTAISGTSLLTCQSNRFIDNSSNAFTITVNGDARVTDFGPFSPAYPGLTGYNQSDITNWSGYFDGTGDYLQAPNNSAFAFGTGDFTVEMWAYFADTGGTNKPMFDTGASSNTGRLLIRQGDNAGAANVVNVFLSGTTISSPTFKFNEWTHVAAVRSSGTVKIYINGVGGTGVSATADLTQTAGLIGRFYDTAVSFFGYLSNIRAVKGTAIYTSDFTPPTTNLTAISGTSLLTCQNAAFTDNSTNNFTLTQYGNPTVTGNSPFNTVGYWSNSFPITNNGSDNLNFGTNAGLSFTAADDFTVEAWVQLTTHNTYSVICSKGNANTREWSVNINSTTMYFYWSTNGSSSGDTSVTASFSFQIGTLYHIAACKSGSSVRLFVNGTQIGSTGTFTSIYNGSGPFRIATFMDFAGISHCFAGYISNLRVVKGTALYTSNFTVPTAPLTAVSGTSILTCQNGRFIDNSTNNLTATVSGVPSVQSYNPFYTSTIASNGGSMFFDGTGDYLYAPNNSALNIWDNGAGSFTVEAWIYATASIPNNVSIVGKASLNGSTPFDGWAFQVFSGVLNVNTASNNRLFSNSTAVPLNQWVHCVLVKSGSTVSIYQNGTRVGTTTNSNAYSNTVDQVHIAIDRNPAGSTFPGYISNLRMVKGTAVYDPSQATITVPTAPANPTPATTLLVNGMNAGIYDATTINDMETVSNVYVSTAVSKFGASSIRFNGADYLKLPSTNELAFGTGDFTIEAWVYITSLSGDWFVISSIGSGGFFLGQRSGSGWGYGRTAVAWDYNTGVNPVANTWQHLAISRSGTSMRMFVDGTQIGTTQSSATDYSLAIGGTAVGSQGAIYYMAGYLDDLRVTKGVARYTSNFTPPTQAFPSY